MSKKKSSKAPWLSLLEAVGITLGVYVLLQLLLALLMVKGILPQEHTVVSLVAACGIASLLGGVFAVRKVMLSSALTRGILNSACFCAVLALLGIGIYGRLMIQGSGGLLLVTALLGGLVAGLLGNRKGKKKSRRR